MAGQKTVSVEGEATSTKCKEQWELSATEKLELAENLKTKGTILFKDNEVAKALAAYSRARYTLDEDPNYTDQELVTKTSLFLSVNLNCALCQLKLEQWNNVLDSCDFALQIEPQNEKALFRKAQAYMGRKDYANAVSAFQSVLHSWPSNKAAINSLAVARQNLKMDNSNQKQAYAGMFQKFADKDTQKDALKKARGAIHNEPIGYWSNDMAAGMMSLQQEMEAFGERMPERSRRSSGGSGGSSPRP